MSEDFFSFLVDETMKLQKSGEVELSSFELKLKDYGLGYLKGEFIPQSQMLRFSTQFGALDIPINWKMFSVDDHHMNHLILDGENDPDQFFSVLTKVWNPKMEKMLITHADGFCYIVGLKAGEDCFLHDLMNPQQWVKTA
jgi:hypothetical protein